MSTLTQESEATRPQFGTVTPAVVAALQSIVGEEAVLTEERQVRSGSKDSYHFSPVLIPQLDGQMADVIVRPQTQAQLRDIIALAVRERIPLTPRGAGTGNYGQGVPLFGGILVSTQHLNRLVHINADEACVEAGYILYDIEKAAEEHGAELRCFPSTVPTSHTGGFITGGSGGVGSITWGMLREADNVRALRILTIEEEPQDLLITGEDLPNVMHNCGLTAFVTEVTLGLAPKVAWQQYVLAFDTLRDALAAAEALGRDDELRKRLLTAFEWPVPSYFRPLVKRGGCPEGKHLVFLYTDEGPEAVAARAAALGGAISYHDGPRSAQTRGFQIYDYTWNHTTQWAMKTDPALTYLQDGFVIERLVEQIEARKALFPEVQEHVEFTRGDGELRAGGLTIVRFSTKERLWALIDYCEANDIRVSNPHTYFLDDDTRWYGEGMLEAKRRWDPHGLLNPGHLHALETS
ncbi:MAG: FAD-binding oxidoreductase [Pseudomonadota bacterium]